MLICQTTNLSPIHKDSKLHRTQEKTHGEFSPPVAPGFVCDLLALPEEDQRQSWCQMHNMNRSPSRGSQYLAHYLFLLFFSFLSSPVLFFLVFSSTEVEKSCQYEYSRKIMESGQGICGWDTAWCAQTPMSTFLVRGYSFIERRDWRERHGSSKVYLYGLL